VKQKTESRQRQPSNKQLKMKIMKTKIKTLLAICVLGFMGLINIQAIADEKKVANTELNIPEAELLASETLKAEELFIVTAEELTAQGADAEIEKYALRQVQLVENSASRSEFLDSAEIYTATGADLEIEKYAKKQIELLRTRTGK
jgi:mannitol-specific phosphotransferase system IIBC component